MICIADLETISEQNLNVVGREVYANDPSTDIMVLTYQFIDEDDPQLWVNPNFQQYSERGRDDAVLERFNEHVRDGGYVVFHNSAFDRRILERIDCGIDCIPLDQVLCSQTQAEAYALPGGLKRLTKALRLTHGKMAADGERLIKKFANRFSAVWKTDWSARDYEDWELFLDYAVRDTEATLEVWQKTRPLTEEEWEDFHVLERINDRGVPYDHEYAKKALKWGDVENARLVDKLRELTGNAKINFRSSKAKLEYFKSLMGEDCPFAHLLLTKKKKKVTLDDGTKKTVQTETEGLGRPVQVQITRWIDEGGDVGDADIPRIVEYLDLLEQSGGVAVAKFKKMIEVGCDGRLKDQYRAFPTQTGRHASRGVQIQNVVRDSLSDTDYAMDVISAEDPTKECVTHLEEFFDLPINRILGRTIRPTFRAEEGEILIWADLAGIEARALPWLANAEEALQPYRDGVDVYCQDAQAITGIPWEEIRAGYKAGDDTMAFHRQVGKTARLSLGFGGGAFAFLGMARKFEFSLPLDQVRQIVSAWRAGNQWCTKFWKDLNNAAWAAFNNPGQPFKAGRVTYMRVGEDLYCFLPSSRPIVYPEIRAERQWKEAWDKYVTQLTYRKMHDGHVVRGSLWGGLQAENVTQAVGSADLIRYILLTLQELGHRVILQTHDEVMVECLETEADRVEAEIIQAMETPPVWGHGLPLKAEAQRGRFYSK